MSEATLYGLEADRAKSLFQALQANVHRRADRLFAKLMVVQWLAGIAAALWLSPKTWVGAASQTHWHVWAAIFLGGSITSFPVYLAWKQPGAALTRVVIAAAQMLTSALLIHLSGGRIETHFHIFGSLAFLAFYRDWRVLLTATIVVALDHMLRGIFWPQSVFGVLTTSSWRWIEHAGWVAFEDIFLFISIRQSLADMNEAAAHRARLEFVNANIERQIVERTSALTQAHEGLQASEQRFRMLSASAPIGIFETDAAGDTLYTNQYWQNLSSLTLDESLGCGWLRAIHPEDKAGVQADWKSVVSNGGEFDSQFRFFSPDGKVRWVHARSAVTRSKSGEVTGFVGTTEDISERLEHEKELKRMQGLLNSVIENLPITVFLKEANELRFVLWNKAGEKLLGFSNAELLGKNDYDFFPREQADIFVANDRKALANGELVEIPEETLQTRAHGPRVMHTRKIPIFDATGTPTHLLGISEDITERKQGEAKLEAAHRELIEISRRAGMAEVATGVLHNVGNVLNSVNVSSACVLDTLTKSKVGNVFRLVDLLHKHEANLGDFVTNDPKGKQLAAYLKTLGDHLASEQALALKELAHLQKNIEHIKDIVTMQQSFAKVSGVTEKVNPIDLVEDALKMNATTLMRHNIQVIKQFENVPPFTVEKHKVLQILVNLIRNAMHACDDSAQADKQLIVRIEQGQENVLISVADNGVGIPQENLTRIFSHGFTTKKDGHGFGLHSGALAAKQMGGSLNAQSAGREKGALFCLEIPSAPIRNHHAA